MRNWSFFVCIETDNNDSESTFIQNRMVAYFFYILKYCWTIVKHNKSNQIKSYILVSNIHTDIYEPILQVVPPFFSNSWTLWNNHCTLIVVFIMVHIYYVP
jgi:hypothetical protein